MPDPKPTIGVLLVERSPADAQRVLEVLDACRAPRCYYATVATLPDAKLQLNTSTFDVVVWSAAADGTDLNEFRQAEPCLPVVALLSAQDELRVQEALQHGADETLAKGGLTPASLSRVLLRARARSAYRTRDLEPQSLVMELRRAEQALQVRETHAQELVQLSHHLERAEIHADILASARKAIEAVIGLRRVWLYQLSRDGEYLHLVLEDEGGDPLEQQGEGRRLLVAGDPMLEEIVAGTKVVVVEDARTDPRTNKKIVQALGNRTIVNVPIILAGRTLGALGTGTFGEEGVRPLTPMEREFLAALGSHVAAALDRVTAAAERDRAVASLQLFRLLVDQSNDAFEVIDAMTGRFLDANARGYSDVGYTRDELLALSLFDIDPTVTPETWPQRRDALRRAKRLTVSGMHRRKDGSIFPVEVNVCWVELDRLYLVAVARDVTKRKQLEEQFRQSQKMEAVGQLAGGVAHDFNNLLCVISGYAELCLMHAEESDPACKMLTEICTAAEQAARLTRQLLAFSRQQVLAPTVLDLNGVVTQMRNMLRRLIGEDVLLTTVLAPELDPVRVDEGQINQVIVNLAVNARDAMPEGGRLTLETRNVERPAKGDGPARKGVLLSIADTGAGMPPEVRERIFEPFFTTKGVGRGTGLGLAVVHGIIQQSEGEIEVVTEEGMGTTFRIYLPAVAPVASLPASDPERPPGRGTETILLVEDEELVRNFAAHALTPFGYTILKAASGREALQLAAAHAGPIHLLITDVVMPGMNGRAVAETLQARDPALRVLFLSGYTDDAVMRHGIRQSEVAFLQKPVSPKLLAAKVRELLDQSPSR
jgi:PAS domain S-box-containing protein